MFMADVWGLTHLQGTEARKELVCKWEEKCDDEPCHLQWEKFLACSSGITKATQALSKALKTGNSYCATALYKLKAQDENLYVNAYTPKDFVGESGDPAGWFTFGVPFLWAARS